MTAPAVKPTIMPMVCLMCFSGNHHQCLGESRAEMVKNKRTVITIMRCVCDVPGCVTRRSAPSN